MADWVAISSLATAGGTLALAATTYASVRSANRAARVAEVSLLAGLRPLLVESGESDETLRVNFFDVHGITVAGGRAAVEIVDEHLYLVVSLRNIGTGIGVLHGGAVYGGWQDVSLDVPPIGEFHMLSRDIYIPPGSVGFWQIAFRDDTPEKRAILAGVENGYLMVDVLYGDFEGGQRTVSRYGIAREDDGGWHLTAGRHWQLDRAEPRQRARAAPARAADEA